MAQEPLKLNVNQPLTDEQVLAEQHFRTWINKVSNLSPIIDTGSPEGVVEAPLYSVYIDETDTSSPAYYRKMLPYVGTDRSMGWVDGATFGDLTVGDLDADDILAESVEITGNDTLVLSGDATCWEDIQSSLIGAKLSSSAGKVDYDYDENTVVFSPSGSISTQADRVSWNIQLPHGCVYGVSGAELRLHIHFEDTGISGTFTCRYRIQGNGDAKTTSWTTVTADTDNAAWTYVSGTLNNILSITNVDISGSGISDIVEFQMTRTDGNTGDISATFVDCHYEARTLGSRTEFTQ